MISFSSHSGVYTLKAVQDINTTLDAAWSFLSNPHNLTKITPSKMGFQITSETPEKVHAGQIITYKVAIFPLFKSNWVTEITQVVPGKYFIDEQRFGPYSMWHHEHFIEQINDSVRMTDQISFKPPFGLIGRLTFPLLIKPQLKKIFEHRREAMEHLFPE